MQSKNESGLVTKASLAHTFQQIGLTYDFQTALILIETRFSESEKNIGLSEYTFSFAKVLFKEALALKLKEI